MKAILAILVILASAQPVPVMACDMHGDAGMDHHAEMPMDMSHDMHTGMDHDMPDQASLHDCCDVGDKAGDGCESSGCMSCAVTVAAVIAPAFMLAAVPAVTWSATHAERLAPSHDAHPYRPPRALS